MHSRVAVQFRWYPAYCMVTIVTSVAPQLSPLNSFYRRSDKSGAMLGATEPEKVARRVEAIRGVSSRRAQIVCSTQSSGNRRGPCKRLASGQNPNYLIWPVLARRRTSARSKFKYGESLSLLSPANSLSLKNSSLFPAVGNWARSHLGTAICSREQRVLSPKNGKIPAKFPVCREFAWRPARSALRRQPAGS
jgi:hypothetical protein